MYVAECVHIVVVGGHFASLLDTQLPYIFSISLVSASVSNSEYYSPVIRHEYII